MDGQYHSETALSVAQFRMERVVQDGSGPIERVHELDFPSLVYLLPEGERSALGCFGEPRSHRSFRPFGSAIVVPARVPLHVRSPAFAHREMIIVRFDEARFGTTTGVSASSNDVELAACTDVHSSNVIDTLQRLSVELSRPDIARETILTGLGLTLLGEVARHFARLRDTTLTRRGTLAGWQIQRIDERLAVHHLPPPDIDALARVCGIGRRHLMRAYKATTGTTVMEHVERTLFQRACRLLESDQRPIKTIAGELGFTSQGSFATAFRRRVGQTPSNWRTRRRAEMAARG